MQIIKTKVGKFFLQKSLHGFDVYDDTREFLFTVEASSPEKARKEIESYYANN